jgi:hypothetical protein
MAGSPIEVEDKFKIMRHKPAYEQGQRKKGNPASGPEGTVNSEPVNAYK